MGVSMVRITVSGLAGSGTSTLVKGLMTHFNWTSLNGGDVFREEAKRRGMTLEMFNELCKNELEVDQELDTLLQQRMQGEGSADIVESRLAGWWAHRLGLPCLRIWLDVSPQERARRVVAREGGSEEEAMLANAERSKVNNERFMMLYQLIPEDPEPYTHVIPSSNLNAAEILEHVIALLEASS